jgi:hypothetical protein
MTAKSITVNEILKRTSEEDGVLSMKWGKTFDKCTYLDTKFITEVDEVEKLVNPILTITKEEPFVISYVRESKYVQKDSGKIKYTYRAIGNKSKNEKLYEAFVALNDQWGLCVANLREERLSELTKLEAKKKQPQEVSVKNSKNDLYTTEYYAKDKATGKTTDELKVFDDPQISILIELKPYPAAFFGGKAGKPHTRLHYFDNEDLDENGKSKKKILTLGETSQLNPSRRIKGDTKYWGDILFGDSNNYTDSDGFRLKPTLGWGYIEMGTGESGDTEEFDNAEEEKVVKTSKITGDSDDDAEEPVKTRKTTSKKKAVSDDEEPVKKAPAKDKAKKMAKKVESSDEEEDSEEEEPVKKPLKKVAKPAEPVKKLAKKPAKKEESDEEDEPVKKPVKKVTKKEESDDESDEETVKKPVKKPVEAVKKAPAKKAPVKKEESEEEDES